MDKSEFYNFIDDYNIFWQQVLEKEKEKLNNISLGQLDLVQKSIQDQQAVIMQINNLEEKRMRLQREAGLDGKSFREIIEDAPSEEKPRLTKALELFEKIIGEVRYYNDKSNKIAKDHLDMIGVSADDEKLGGYAPDKSSKGVLLGTKI